MNNSNNIKWNFSSYTDAKGRTYIISYYNHWDPEKKQSRIAKRIHVGNALWEKSKARGILDALKHVFGDEDGANLLRLGFMHLSH